MVGVIDWMTSPSSSSTRRSTPCVLGCCGPMLTVIVSVRSSAMFEFGLTVSSGVRSLVFGLCPAACGAAVSPVRAGALGVALTSAPRAVSLEIRLELGLAHFQRLVGLRRLADLHRVVLARGMA